MTDEEIRLIIARGCEASGFTPDMALGLANQFFDDRAAASRLRQMLDRRDEEIAWLKEQLEIASREDQR